MSIIIFPPEKSNRGHGQNPGRFSGYPSVELFVDVGLAFKGGFRLLGGKGDFGAVGRADLEEDGRVRFEGQGAFAGDHVASIAGSDVLIVQLGELRRGAFFGGDGDVIERLGARLDA